MFCSCWFPLTEIRSQLEDLGHLESFYLLWLLYTTRADPSYLFKTRSGIINFFPKEALSDIQPPNLSI